MGVVRHASMREDEKCNEPTQNDGCISMKSMGISGSDSLEVPTIYKAYIYKAYVSEYPHKIWPNIWY